MSEIRASFYEAINKANTQKPKVNKVRRFSYNETPSIEEQIKSVINESAVIAEPEPIDNTTVVEWMYNSTKDMLTESELKELKVIEEINKLRDEARKEYNLLNRMNERIFVPSAANAAAGAGSGGGRRNEDDTENTYVENGYVQNYVV
jgi:hypothetical protein